jgi:hypothetical protein
LVARPVISSRLCLFLFIRKSKQSLKLVNISSDSVWPNLKPLNALFHSGVYDETSRSFVLKI